MGDKGGAAEMMHSTVTLRVSVQPKGLNVQIVVDVHVDARKEKLTL